MGKRKNKSDRSEEGFEAKSLDKRLKRIEEVISKFGDRQKDRSRSSSTHGRRRHERGYSRSPERHRRDYDYTSDSGRSFISRTNYRERSASEREDTPQRDSSSQAGRSEKSGSTAPNGENDSNVPLDRDCDKENNPPDADIQKDLDSDVLQALGERLVPDRVFEPAIHKDLAVRLQEVLTEGLPVEERKSLLKKFNLPENGLFLDPPKLNFEVKASLQDVGAKRDARIIEKQERITASIAGLLKLMTLLLQSSNEKIAMIKIVSDVLRILTDLQHEESLIRRSLILKNIDASMRDTLNSTGIDEWLFGKDLEEKVKAAKVLETSSKRLQPKNHQNQNSDSKNWKGPPRRPTYKTKTRVTSSGQKFRDQKYNHRRQKPTLQKWNQQGYRKKE